MTLFSKWLPGGHIRFFGFWMAWFRQRNSSLLWNFSLKFHVHVLSGCRQKPNDCHYVAFKMAALWFWTVFNCNPPIAHCHPLLWGGGILVDHWSTISSFFLWNVIIHQCSNFSSSLTKPLYRLRHVFTWHCFTWIKILACIIHSSQIWILHWPNTDYAYWFMPKM